MSLNKQDKVLQALTSWQTWRFIEKKKILLISERGLSWRGSPALLIG